MAYTPELSFKASCTLRRVSWALGVPMSKGIKLLLEYLPKILDAKKYARPVGIRPEARIVFCRHVQNKGGDAVAERLKTLVTTDFGNAARSFSVDGLKMIL